MNIKELERYQKELEIKYEELDREIRETDINDEEKNKRLNIIQNQIDEQLDLLDDILEGIREVPRKYNELSRLRQIYQNNLEVYDD